MAAPGPGLIKRRVGDRDLETGLYVERNEMASVIISEDAHALMSAYNAAVAKDQMAARGEYLKGVGVPPTKGR